MAQDDLILGIDGGGTKTVAWLACSAAVSAASEDVAHAGRAHYNVLGRGISGPSNPQAVGFDEALANLDRAIAAAWQDATIPQATVAAAVLGLAGSDRDENRRAVENWAAERRLARSLRVVHDGLITLSAGSPDGCGVALISGTGSLAFGRAHDGRTARAGGWGFLLSDEGSGYAIARKGLRAAMRAADGRGPATAILDRLLAHFQLAAPQQMVRAVYAVASDPAAVAGLAELVVRAAADHDAVADEILDHAAGDLAELVAAALAKLGCTEPAFPLVLSGGLLLGAADLQGRLTRCLAGRGLRPEPLVEVREPVAGAVRLAQADAA